MVANNNMTLTFEEYKKLKQEGLSQQQIISQKTPQQEIKPREGFLQKTGRFLGLEGLGKGISSAILVHTDKEYKRILQKAHKGEVLTPGEVSYMTSIANEIPSEREVIGSAIQTAATVATLGGAAKASTIKMGMTKMGILGGTSGLGKGIEQEKSVGDVLKQTFTSGVMSAATYGVLAGAGKVAKSVLKELPVRLMRSTAKLEKEAAQQILDAKQVGSLGKLKGFADAEMKRLNGVIQSKMQAKNGTINSKEFIDDVVTKIQKEFTGVSKDKILKAIKSADIEPFLKNKTVDFVSADKIRQELGNAIGNAWRTDNPKFHSTVRETLWKGIVNRVRPQTNTTAEFAQYAPLIQATKSIAKTMANQSTKFGLSLYDIPAGGIGAAVGGAPGVIGGMVLRRMVDSTTGKTVTAVGINELGKIIEKIPTDTAGKISTTLLINLFKGK